MNDEKRAMTQIQIAMDNELKDCTNDGVVIFVNGWGRVCAKIESRSRGVIHGWGDTILEALVDLNRRIPIASNV